MVPKCELPENIPLYTQELNYETNVYELKDHVEGNELNSMAKTWSHKKKLILQVFLVAC